MRTFRADAGFRDVALGPRVLAGGIKKFIALLSRAQPLGSFGLEVCRGHDIFPRGQRSFNFASEIEQFYA